MDRTRGANGSPPRLRIRGIYATALTARLGGLGEVVQATPPIARRFGEPFPPAEHDVAVATTDDRLGVGVAGDPAGVETVVEALADVSIDTMHWADPTPEGAVFDATVTETLGRGAVVDLGPREAYLPFDAADGHVATGDERRVQVHGAAPPWADYRPEAGERIRLAGGLVSLVRGGDGPTADVRDDGHAAELVRLTALLPAAAPDGWAVRWERGAVDADMDRMATALERQAERAAALEAHLDGGEPPAAGAWVQFGRSARFALDEDRRAVAPTMPGHHRIKLGGAGASVAVDLVERLGADDHGGFPFEAVAAVFGPSVGDRVRIVHGKPEGRRFPLGRGEVTDRDGETVTVRRAMTAGGEYDALGVPRVDGDVAITTLVEGRWWYPTVYRDAAGDSKGTYVNVCTPVEILPEAATYVDLHVDVVRHADGTVERVDDDELDAAVAAGHVSEPLAEKAREVATAVERALSPRSTGSAAGG